MQVGALTGVRDLEAHKRLYDEDLQRKDFSRTRSVVIWLRNRPDVVCSSVIPMDHDFQGRPIQYEAEIYERLDFLSLSILATPTGGAIVLAWRADSDSSAERFARSLLQLSEAGIPHAIIRLAFTCSENIYLSIPWWDQLSSEVREFLTARMLMNAHPETEAPPEALIDDGLRLVKWRVERVETTFTEGVQ